MRDTQQQHSPQQPHTEPASHLAKEPQQGGFKGQVCSAFISISFSGSLWDGRLEPRALLEIRADPHLAKTQLKVAPVEEQHGQLLQEAVHGTPGPIAPPGQGHTEPAQEHPQDSGTLKKGALVPHRADHGDTGTAERCKCSRTTVNGTRHEPDPPKESREEAGVGVRTAAPGSVYWRSKRCQSPARMHRWVREKTTRCCLVTLILTFLLCSRHAGRTGGHPKTLAMGGRAWQQLEGCVAGAWLQ